MSDTISLRFYKPKYKHIRSFLYKIHKFFNKNYPYVFNEKYKIKMRVLAREYRLGFYFNPGGGEFFNRNYTFRCQISTYDDKADYRLLKKAIKKAKLRRH